MSKDFGDSGMFYGASPILFSFARKLRANETKAEKALWEKLQNKQFSGLRFKRQHPIKYFIADFYCHQEKLVIEIDGGGHYLPDQYEYDINRDFELSQLGLTVLRFSNADVTENVEWVLEKIKEHLSTN